MIEAIDKISIDIGMHHQMQKTLNIQRIQIWFFTLIGLIKDLNLNRQLESNFMIQHLNPNVLF